MAIKIIKEGPKEFIVTCTKCGTVFSYELSDLVECGNYAVCPSCGSKCYHFISNTATKLPVKDSNIQYPCADPYEKIPYWMRPDYKAPEVTCKGTTDPCSSDSSNFDYSTVSIHNTLGSMTLETDSLSNS